MIDTVSKIFYDVSAETTILLFVRLSDYYSSYVFLTTISTGSVAPKSRAFGCDQPSKYETYDKHQTETGLELALATWVYMFSKDGKCAYYQYDRTRSLDPVTLKYSRNLAVQITSDFHGNWRPQYQSNLLQIRRVSEQVIKGHNKKHVNNNS